MIFLILLYKQSYVLYVNCLELRIVSIFEYDLYLPLNNYIVFYVIWNINYFFRISVREVFVLVLVIVIITNGITPRDGIRYSFLSLYLCNHLFFFLLFTVINVHSIILRDRSFFVDQLFHNVDYSIKSFKQSLLVQCF